MGSIYRQSYDFFGKIIEIRSDRRDILKNLHLVWGEFSSAKLKAKPQAIIEILRENTFPKISKKQFFQNDHLLLMINKNQSIVAQFHQYSWQIYVQMFKELSAKHIVFELGFVDSLLTVILNRLGVQEVHAAVLGWKKKAILMPGKAGSGKTTTSLQLVKEGFTLLADDQVFLKEVKQNIHAFANNKKLRFLLGNKSIDLFPELKFLKKLPYSKMKPAPKRALTAAQLKKIYNCKFSKEEKIQAIVFPRITTRKTSRIKPISSQQALLKLLGKTSRSKKSLIKDQLGITKQFNLFCLLSTKYPAYDLEIGQENKNVPQLIRDVLR